MSSEHKHSPERKKTESSPKKLSLPDQIKESVGTLSLEIKRQSTAVHDATFPATSGDAALPYQEDLDAFQKEFETLKEGGETDNEFYRKQFKDPAGNGNVAIKKVQAELESLLSAQKNSPVEEKVAAETKRKEIEATKKLLASLEAAKDLAFLAQVQDMAAAIYPDLTLPDQEDKEGNVIKGVPFFDKKGFPIKQKELESVIGSTIARMNRSYSAEQKQGSDIVTITSNEVSEGRPPYKGADGLLDSSSVFGRGDGSKHKLNLDNLVTLTPGTGGDNRKGAYVPFRETTDETRYLAYGLVALGHQVTIKNTFDEKSINNLNKELGPINDIYKELRKEGKTPTSYEVYKKIGALDKKAKPAELQKNFARGLIYEGNDPVKEKIFGQKLAACFESLETSKEVNNFIEGVGEKNLHKIDRGAIAFKMHLISDKNQKMINKAWKKYDREHSSDKSTIMVGDDLHIKAEKEFKAAQDQFSRVTRTVRTLPELTKLETMTYLTGEQMARMQITEAEQKTAAGIAGKSGDRGEVQLVNKAIQDRRNALSGQKPWNVGSKESSLLQLIAKEKGVTLLPAEDKYEEFKGGSRPVDTSSFPKSDGDDPFGSGPSAGSGTEPQQLRSRGSDLDDSLSSSAEPPRITVVEEEKENPKERKGEIASVDDPLPELPSSEEGDPPTPSSSNP